METGRRLLEAEARSVAEALAGWLAASWELDPRDAADRSLLEDETDLIESALTDPHADRMTVTTLLQEMYGRLRDYRAVRGKVESDETLDDWIAACWIIVRGYVEQRLRSTTPS